MMWPLLSFRGSNPSCRAPAQYAAALVSWHALLNNISSVRCGVRQPYAESDPCPRKESAEERVPPTDARRPPHPPLCAADP